jgi:hypothetical protein
VDAVGAGRADDRVVARRTGDLDVAGRRGDRDDGEAGGRDEDGGESDALDGASRFVCARMLAASRQPSVRRR